MISEGYNEDIAKREEHMSRASIQLADFFQSLPELENVLAPNLFPTIIWVSMKLNQWVHGNFGNLKTISKK